MKQFMSPEDRWEFGVSHDARTEELFSFLRNYDNTYCDGHLDLQCGGDGDYGEELMYIADEFFANKDTGNT